MIGNMTYSLLLSLLSLPLVIRAAETADNGKAAQSQQHRRTSVAKTVEKPQEPPPFALPIGVEVLAKDGSGRTWRMNGRIKGTLADSKKSLYKELLKAKYDFKHETALDEAKTHLHSTWVKSGSVLLMMLWQDGEYIYFSWGTYRE